MNDHDAIVHSQNHHPTTDGLPPAVDTIMSETDDDLLTIPEAAELLKVSTVTISRWRRQGRLPALKIGPRAVRIRRGDLLTVFAPYNGPLESLDRANAYERPNLVSESVIIPRTAGGNDVSRKAARRVAAVGRAVALRETILSRRTGQFLPPAGDEIAKIREKKPKRKG